MIEFATVIVLGLLVGFAISLVLAWPLMLLWNYVMPTVFSLPTIGFWQALAIMFLSSMLFKSTSFRSNN